MTLVEQLGVGRVGLVQLSSCTRGIISNYAVKYKMCSSFLSSQLRSPMRSPGAPRRAKCEFDSSNVTFPSNGGDASTRHGIVPLGNVKAAVS